MVALVFSVVGHDFERGLMILRNSLTEALAGLEKQRVEIMEEYEAYNAKLLAGGEPEGQYEEGVGWIHEKSDEFDFDLNLIEETKSTVRKTHVISLYHLWERTIRQWSDSHGHGSHDDLAKSAEVSGLPSDPRLKWISLLNNALKHNSQRAGPMLLADRPDLFPNSLVELLKSREVQAAKLLEEKGLGDGHYRPDWFDLIVLTDAHMDEVFGGVRESGPRANTPRKHA